MCHKCEIKNVNHNGSEIEKMDGLWEQFEYVQNESDSSKAFTWNAESLKTRKLTLGDVLARAGRFERRKQAHGVK